MELFKSNSKRQAILYPLFEWRYLGASEIRDASGYRGSQVGLWKFLNRLEREGLVESFLHLYSGRKFYYLTKKDTPKLHRSGLEPFR